MSIFRDDTSEKKKTYDNVLTEGGGGQDWRVQHGVLERLWRHSSISKNIRGREYQTHNPALIFYHGNDELVFKQI